ncbi:porin [Rhizobium panacihumi]|uniref:porin n=1 Tax=Rhizobium panacihumi TaxID=2008450 RepID=UPI003D7ABCC3
MNIKSLLLGSAAALAAVSGAQAADAIVAAEPEPMEYVRVCDAFGTGYFYIPGTETCLKIGGYVRVQVDGRSDFDFDGPAGGVAQEGGYRTNTRGYLTIAAKSDTELGTLGSSISLEADTNGGSQDFFVDEAIIQLGGLQVGYFYNYFDNGLPGETVLSDGGPLGSAFGYIGGDTLNNSIRYTFDGGAFQAYIQADFFDSQDGWKDNVLVFDPVTGDLVSDRGRDEIGVNAMIAGKFGGVAIDLFGAYDFDFDDGVIASTLAAEIGPGTLGVFGVYSFGPSRYWDFAEWSIGAEYAIKVTDKFSIAPGAQYWSNIVPVYSSSDYAGGDAWRVGVTADYEITTNLKAKATVNYTSADYDLNGIGDGDRWDGFLRLQRSF